MKLLIIIIDCSPSIVRRRSFVVRISETGLAQGPSYTFGFSLPVRGWLQRAGLWRSRIQRPHSTIRVALGTYAQASITEKRPELGAIYEFR